MKRVIYIMAVVFVLTTILSGCISAKTIEDIEDDIDNLKDEISEIEDDNEDLEDEIANLKIEKDTALEYNEELEKQIERLSQDVEGSYDITFNEYYTQLVYLSLVWEMDMFESPEVVNMDNGDVSYVFMAYYGDSDTTCSNYEIYVETDSATSKVLCCTVAIVQDEEYRGKGDAYTIGYKATTEIVLSALILAQYSPNDPSEISLDLLEKIQENDSEVCAEYNISCDVYEDAECEARFFRPLE